MTRLHENAAVELDRLGIPYKDEADALRIVALRRAREARKQAEGRMLAEGRMIEVPVALIFEARTLANDIAKLQQELKRLVERGNRMNEEIYRLIGVESGGHKDHSGGDK